MKRNERSIWRADVFAIVAVCLAVSVLELLWHWFIAKNSSGLARTMLLFYLDRDPRSGKGSYPWVDSIAPAVLLGIAVGWIGRRWENRKAVWSVFLVSANIVVLQAIYPWFFSSGVIWWTVSGHLAPGTLALSVFWSIVLAGFFVLVGRFGFLKV